MDSIKRFLPAIVLILLSYWAVQPLLFAGFFPMHDDTQVARVYEMKQALSDGQFPVRWVSDLGYNYGYPIFNFYAPFAYYVGGFLAVFGLDALMATKLMMIIGVLFAGISMYLLAREFWGEAGGVVSGLLYIYAPYHAVNIYVRGAVAEFWAYAFVPLVFLGVYKLFVLLTHHTKPVNHSLLWMWTCIGSLGYAGIIISHNLTAMMVTPFLVATVVILFVLARKKPQSYFLFLPLLFGIVLTAFYWLPTLQEMSYTNVTSVIGGKSDVNLHFVCPSQLLNSPWGFGGSTPGCVDGMSFKIGKIHLALVVLSFFALGFLWKKQKDIVIISSSFFVFLLSSLFLMLQESASIWNMFHQMAFFQFPWRFLLLVSFFISFLAGATFFVLQTKTNHLITYGISSIVIVVILLTNIGLFIPQTQLQKTAADYTNVETLTWTTSKISDEYLPQGFEKPRRKSEVPQTKMTLSDSSARITDLETKTNNITAVVDSPKKTRATFNIAYFPAWQVFIDEEKTGYSVFHKGLYVTIPSGKHSITARFIQTPIETLANTLSLTGVLALLIGIIITQRKDVTHAKNKKST